MKKHYEVYLEIENRCLMDCKHCSSYEMRQLNNTEFIYPDLLKILRLIRGKTHLYLTGGEPLLYDGLIKTIKNIKKDVPNTKIGLFTCGIINLPEGIGSISLRDAKLLKESGVYDCYLSIYHKDERIHDFITNRPSSHKNVLKTIRNLKASGIKVKIHLVLNNFNILNIEDTISFIEQIGVDEIRLLRLVKGGSAILNWNKIGVSYDIQNEAIYKIIDKIDTFSTKITISGFPEYYPCRPVKNSVKCQAGTNLLYITYQGEVYPCACTKNQKSLLIGKIHEIEKIQKYIVKMEEIDHHSSCLNPIHLD